MDDVSSSENEPATKADLHAVRDELISVADARFNSHDRRFESVEGNLRRLNIGFARMEGDMTELKGKVDILLGVKEDFSQFKSSIDRMTTYFESCVRKMDSQGSMLMEHEDRISKLEPRPS